MRKLAAYSWADRRLVIEAFLLLVLLRLGLWLLPIRVILRFARWAGQRPRLARAPNENTAPRIAWAVKSVSRRVPGATCLPQALAAQVLLGRRGIESHLHIGVAKNTVGRLVAHAWIDREGIILIGNLPDLKQYVEFPSLELVQL